MDEFQKKFFKNAFKKENYLQLKKYDIKNPFLNDEQKIVVEAWFQFPIVFFEIFFFSCFIFLKGLTVFEIILYSYLIGITVAVINWRFVVKFFILLGQIIGGNVSSLISVIFAVYFGIHNQWTLVVLALFSALGITGFLSPSMWLYSFLSIGKPNSKYIFAKKYFDKNKTEKKEIYTREAVQKFMNILSTKDEMVEALIETRKKYNIRGSWADIDNEMIEKFIKFTRNEEEDLDSGFFSKILLRIKKYIKHKDEFDILYDKISKNKQD
jgi:hypothetical protein